MLTVRALKPDDAEAWAALRRNDCEGAWNILWPLAKNGDQEARYYLYWAVVQRINPPDVATDPAILNRHFLTLSAYAALRPTERYSMGVASDGRFARIEVPVAISRLNLGEHGERVAQCYKAGEPLDACLQLGVSLGVIQEFEDYARDTDRRVREAGAKARCLPRH